MLAALLQRRVQLEAVVEVILDGATPYWMMGLSTSANISFGITFVAGKKRVPSPPAGKTAFRIRLLIPSASSR
jgi:hypothetical protein